MDILKEAKAVYDTQISALQKCKDTLSDDFVSIVNDINRCTGRIIITGVGKSGHICKKISATMSSLGIKSFFLHPADALHGDMGCIDKEDITIVFSRSGESNELLMLIPAIKAIGSKIISITGRSGSSLSKLSDTNYVLPQMEEVFLDDTVPTTSTTAALLFGDTIAVIVAKLRGFTKNDFAKFHPSGDLGRRLTLTAGDLMRTGEENSVIIQGDSLKNAIFEMCKKPVGGVTIVDSEGVLTGVFTQGDLRRHFVKQTPDFENGIINDYMTETPKSVKKSTLVVDALKMMNSDKGTFPILPVIDENKRLLGTLCLTDIVKSGLV